MTWVKIDDNLPQNPKLRRVSVAARWAYISSICYAGNNRTDGFIPFGALALLDANNKISVDLVAVNLWEPAEGGWYIHDFLLHNRSKERIADIVDKRREAGRIGQQKRQQNADQNDEHVALSVSVSVDPPVLQEGVPDTDRQSAQQIAGAEKPRHKPIDEAFLAELQSEHPTVNVRAIYERAKNRKTWDGYKDKRRALRDHIGYALKDAGGSNANGRNGTQPDISPRRQQLIEAGFELG